MTKKYERWLVLPDLQIPYHDRKTLSAVEKYIADVQKSNNPFVGWLQLGDYLDFDELSRYNVGYEASIKGDVAKSYKEGNAFLDRHQELMSISKKPYRMVLLQGNHCYRAVDFGLKHPHLASHLDYETNLNLDERGVEFVKCWETGELFRLGNAYFTHGKYVGGNHAKKMVENYGVCVYFGHTHDIMEYPKIFYGNDRTVVGKSLGTLCEYQQHYLKGAPTNWQQAFSEFFVFRDGYFQELTHKIFKSRFVGMNGKVYTP